LWRIGQTIECRTSRSTDRAGARFSGNVKASTLLSSSVAIMIAASIQAAHGAEILPIELIVAVPSSRRTS
jgi:hypothetical protein